MALAESTTSPQRSLFSDTKTHPTIATSAGAAKCMVLMCRAWYTTSLVQESNGPPEALQTGPGPVRNSNQRGIQRLPTPEQGGPGHPSTACRLSARPVGSSQPQSCQRLPRAMQLLQTAGPKARSKCDARLEQGLERPLRVLHDRLREVCCGGHASAALLRVDGAPHSSQGGRSTEAAISRR